MSREVAERRRVEASLQSSESNLREVLKRRERLARDIHDNTIQSVFSLGSRLRRMERTAGDSALKNELDGVTDQINRIIADMRNLIAELEPANMQGHSLEEAVGRLAESLRESTGVDIRLDLPGKWCDEIERETQLNLFHIIHEAFSNALRHGKAKQLSCILEADENESLTLSIVDNGGGFDPAAYGDALDGRGRGLRNMRKRAQEIGADFVLTSRRGGPTELRLSGF